MRRPLHRGLVATVALLTLGAVAAIAVLLFQAQTAARQSAERRFAERAQLSAAPLSHSVFTALEEASGEDLARRYGGTSENTQWALGRQLAESRGPYLAVVDARGRTLATAGRAPRRAALGGGGSGPALSDILDRAGGPVIEYAIPFGGGDNRRALVEGVPLKLMATFLHDYLMRLRTGEGTGLAVTDGRGRPIERQGRISRRGETPPERIATWAAVPGTPWTLRLESDRARVMAGVNELAWLSWVLVAALAVAAVIGIAMYGRMLALLRRQREAVRRQREANRKLHDSRAQARDLVEALEEAVVLYHADGRMDLLNASARELLGTEAGSVTSMSPGWELLNEDGDPLAKGDAPVVKTMTTGVGRSRVVGLKRPDGSRRWLTVRARPLMRPGDRTPHAVVASCTDVTEQREMELHLTDLAQRDPLTGLWNCRRFEEDLTRQLDRCRRYGERAALLVLDLDGFKEVNDTLGHQAGDDVLRALANALDRRLRASDSAARIGGDEFAVLLVDVDEAEARAMARKVAARLTDFAREHLEAEIDLSLSIGSAPLGGEAKGVGDVLAAADRAMYADKRRPGRRRARTSGSAAARSVEAAARADGPDTPLRALATAVLARDSHTAQH